jgi:hypothetical protein
MFAIIKYLNNLLSLGRRLREHEERQKKSGYAVDFIQEGPERLIIYKENCQELMVNATFSILNNVVIYTESLKYWDIPRGKQLSPEEYQRVLSRMVEYFSCWGDVALDDSDLDDSDSFKNDLIKRGIEFEEFDDGTIHYQSTAEEARRKKTGGSFES